MLAVALTPTAPPIASAYVQPGSGGGGPSGQPAALTQQHSGDSIDWMIGIGAAGARAVVRTGAAAKRSRRRKQQSAQVARSQQPAKVARSQRPAKVVRTV
jgi:hypothetical protein